MYKPNFPYLGNQAIITSGRVVLHSYDDFIFLFGKKGVSISSPSTFTVDANEKTIIASPNIQLGFDADEPVLLGRSTVVQLGQLLDAIQNLSKELKNINTADFSTVFPSIAKESTVLEGIAGRVKAQLNTSCLSKNTFTK